MERSSGRRELAGTGDRTGTLYSRCCALEDVSFGAIGDGEGRVQWATPDGLEIAGCGVATRIRATGPNRFDRVRDRANRVFDGLQYDGPRSARPRAFGGFAFHDGHEPTPPWTGFEAASFVVPRVQVTRGDDGGWLTVTGTDESDAADALAAWRTRIEGLPAMQPSGSGPGIARTARTTSRAEWTDQVGAALERIDAGALTKVVLAQSLSATLEGAVDVPATLERLRRQYPNCYRFSIDHGGGGTFFGAPPERLVAKRGDRVETEALAGSVPRGATPETDAEFAAAMRESEKVRREHDLVVEAVRDQLEGLAVELAVGDQRVRQLANIQHLRTPISARLEGDRHVLEIVEALHPTPAVGGVPPEAAWETIRSAESFDRGWYAAPVGWFDADGDGEFAVAIRSAVVNGRTAALFAGNGIVADSDPDEEWDEVQLKFTPILEELR